MHSEEQRAAAKATTAMTPVRVAHRPPGHEQQAGRLLRNPAGQPFPQVALWINCLWRRSRKLSHTRQAFDSRCRRACLTVSPVSAGVTGAHPARAWGQVKSMSDYAPTRRQADYTRC